MNAELPHPGPSEEPPAHPLEAPPAHPGCATGREVWLFRHGEVDAAWRGRIYGALDVPLSSAGRRASRALARAFASVPFECVVSSTLERAAQLGRLLAAASNAPLQLTPALREIERGRWVGGTFDKLALSAPHELAAWRARSWTWNGNGGESDGQVWARAWPVFERAVRAGRGPLAIVAHRNVIRVLVSRALGIPPRESFELELDTSRAMRLCDGAQGWSLTARNVDRP